MLPLSSSSSSSRTMDGRTMEEERSGAVLPHPGRGIMYNTYYT